MALNENIYVEIFNNENKWIEQIKTGLINSVYCEYELKPFYIKKLQELKLAKEKNNNPLFSLVIVAIKNIINKIDEFTYNRHNKKEENIQELLPLLLYNQMNSDPIDLDNTLTNIDKLSIKKEVLKTLADNYRQKEKEEQQFKDDYEEEIRMTK